MHNEKWECISKHDATGTLLKLKVSKLQAIGQHELTAHMFALHQFCQVELASSLKKKSFQSYFNNFI